MSKFFNFVDKGNDEVELFITGDIVDNDSVEMYEAFGVDCTAPNGFKEQLQANGNKPLTVYINSLGGDVLAASSIYTMLREYKGTVTVKIDSIAASAASVIAMAGDTVLMAPTATLMIHDPSTVVAGNITEVKQGLSALQSIKEGIINAYERKCKGKISRDKISKLMTDETWLNYNEALEYGFIDGEIGNGSTIITQDVLDSIKRQNIAIYNKVVTRVVEDKPSDNAEDKTVENTNTYKALLLKKHSV